MRQRSLRQEIAYTYNTAGMLTGEGDGAGDTYSYTRSIAGEITGMTDSFSDATDPANIIVPGSVQNGTGGTLQAYGYTATRTGTHVNETCDIVLNVCNSFGYDEFNRLTSRTVTSGTVQNYTYSYDRFGNRGSQTALQTGYISIQRSTRRPTRSRPAVSLTTQPAT
jgi:YD repeat-containing protein